MTYCVPDSTDWACAYTDEELAEIDPAVLERAEILAWTTLAALTGYRIATCPLTVRPCTLGCEMGTYQAWPVWGGTSGTWMRPGINNQGYWVNSCGCSSRDSCSCGALSEVLLPGPV